MLCNGKSQSKIAKMDDLGVAIFWKPSFVTAKLILQSSCCELYDPNLLQVCDPKGQRVPWADTGRISPGAG